jgi:hypothetical protein
MPTEFDMATADAYEITLEEKTRELKACQEEHQHKSCLPCPDLNNCTLRDAYVNAVYESMNKGSGGGFEF